MKFLTDGQEYTMTYKNTSKDARNVNRTRCNTWRPKIPWEEISIDVIGPLPRSKDKDAILVVVDQFSKMIRLMATMTSIFSSKVARIYRDNIWKIHGIPKKIISNRGSQFASTFMGELCKALEIKRAMSIAYYPQTDGQTERINQEVKVFLKHYINYRQDD